MVVTHALRKRWALPAIATLAICLPGPLHAGMVSFFHVPDVRTSCPDGWHEYTPAKGRLIRGTTERSLVGKAVGKPIAAQTAPIHKHSFTAGVKLEHEPVVALGGPNKSLVASRTFHGSDDASSPSNGDLPYMQLLVCEQSGGFPAEKALTAEMVAFFSDPACPDGWEPYDKLNGRFAVPLPSDAASADFNAVVESDSWSGNLNHQHSLVVSTEDAEEKVHLALRDYGLALAKNFWPFRQNTAYAKSTFSDQAFQTGEGDASPPSVSLLACRKTEGRPHTSELPTGILAFMTAEDCPKHWLQKPEPAGRFLVGLPEGGQSGIAFGGNPLRSREMRKHSHGVKAALDLPAIGIAGAHGCCAYGYAHAGKYTMKGNVVSAESTLPYVQMRHCIVTNKNIRQTGGKPRQ